MEKATAFVQRYIPRRVQKGRWKVAATIAATAATTAAVYLRQQEWVKKEEEENEENEEDGNEGDEYDDYGHESKESEREGSEQGAKVPLYMDYGNERSRRRRGQAEGGSMLPSTRLARKKVKRSNSVTAHYPFFRFLFGPLLLLAIVVPLGIYWEVINRQLNSFVSPYDLVCRVALWIILGIQMGMILPFILLWRGAAPLRTHILQSMAKSFYVNIFVVLGNPAQLLICVFCVVYLVYEHYIGRIPLYQMHFYMLLGVFDVVLLLIQRLLHTHIEGSAEDFFEAEKHSSTRYHLHVKGPPKGITSIVFFFIGRFIFGNVFVHKEKPLNKKSLFIANNSAMGLAMLIVSKTIHEELNVLPRTLLDPFWSNSWLVKILETLMRCCPLDSSLVVELMEKGDPVVIFPGGAREVTSKIEESDFSVSWPGDSVYAEIIHAAIQNGYEIVPICTLGINRHVALLGHWPIFSGLPFGFVSLRITPVVVCMASPIEYTLEDRQISDHLDEYDVVILNKAFQSYHALHQKAIQTTSALFT